MNFYVIVAFAGRIRKRAFVARHDLGNHEIDVRRVCRNGSRRRFGRCWFGGFAAIVALIELNFNDSVRTAGRGFRAHRPFARRVQTIDRIILERRRGHAVDRRARRVQQQKRFAGRGESERRMIVARALIGVNDVVFARLQVQAREAINLAGIAGARNRPAVEIHFAGSDVRNLNPVRIRLPQLQRRHVRGHHFAESNVGLRAGVCGLRLFAALRKRCNQHDHHRDRNQRGPYQPVVRILFANAFTILCHGLPPIQAMNGIAYLSLIIIHSNPKKR